MENKKTKIILAIIAAAFIVTVIVLAFVEMSFFKDVPVYAQHLFGHDLDKYKVYQSILIIFVAIILVIASSIIIFVDKKDSEEK